jgi:hypothetical protein
VATVVVVGEKVEDGGECLKLRVRGFSTVRDFGRERELITALTGKRGPRPVLPSPLREMRSGPPPPFDESRLSRENVLQPRCVPCSKARLAIQLACCAVSVFIPVICRCVHHRGRDAAAARSQPFTTPRMIDVFIAVKPACCIPLSCLSSGRKNPCRLFPYVMTISVAKLRCTRRGKPNRP